MITRSMFLIFSLLPAIAGAATSCDGDASAAIEVKWVQVTDFGGHYDTTNNDPSRTIKVTFDLVAGGSFTLVLSPGQTLFPSIDAFHPLQQYKAPCHAKYA